MPKTEEAFIARWGRCRWLYKQVMEKLTAYLGLTLVGVYRAPIVINRGEPPAGVTVNLATANTLAPYCDKPGYQLNRSFVTEAFSLDHACVATFVGESLAAYGWVSYQRAPHLHGLWVRWAPGQRYNYKNYTLPEFRGQHLRGSYGRLVELDEANGANHAIAFIETHNFASIRAELRHGGVQVGFAGYLRAFGKIFTFASPGARRCGFGFYQGPD